MLLRVKIRVMANVNTQSQQETHGQTRKVNTAKVTLTMITTPPRPTRTRSLSHAAGVAKILNGSRRFRYTLKPTLAGSGTFVKHVDVGTQKPAACQTTKKPAWLLPPMRCGTFATYVEMVS